MNDSIGGFINSRKEYLTSMITRIEKELKYAPAGSLNIAHCRNNTQYYMYKGRNEKPEYISVSNTELIHRLAQKDYNKLVLICAKNELSYLKRLEADYSGLKPEDVFDTLSDDRKGIVIPIVQSNEDYAKEWESEEYEGSSYHAAYKRYKTSKGEMVRSKSECIISDHSNSSLLNTDFSFLKVNTVRRFFALVTPT